MDYELSIRDDPDEFEDRCAYLAGQGYRVVGFAVHVWEHGDDVVSEVTYYALMERRKSGEERTDGTRD